MSHCGVGDFVAALDGVLILFTHRERLAFRPGDPARSNSECMRQRFRSTLE